jgi:hypothetical protein
MATDPNILEARSWIAAGLPINQMEQPESIFYPTVWSNLLEFVRSGRCRTAIATGGGPTECGSDSIPEKSARWRHAIARYPSIHGHDAGISLHSRSAESAFTGGHSLSQLFVRRYNDYSLTALARSQV